MNSDLIDRHHKQVLELQSRKTLFQLIKKNQGCHFRDLQRKSGLPLSTLRHHLHYLAKNGLLKEEKKGGNNRYFTQEFSIEQRMLLSLLRQKTIRRILMILMIKKNPSHKEVVEFTKVSPGTVSWHLKKLDEQHIIEAHKKGKHKYYSLVIEKKKIIHLLLSYQQSFMDKLLDNVAEMWEFE